MSDCSITGIAGTRWRKLLTVIMGYSRSVDDSQDRVAFFLHFGGTLGNSARPRRWRVILRPTSPT